MSAIFARAAGFAATLQIYERQPQIQRIELYKMIFVEVANRFGAGEVNFLYEVTTRSYIKTVADALLDRTYPRQYHSPSRFGAPDT